MFPVERIQKRRRTAKLIGQQPLRTNDDTDGDCFNNEHLPVLHGVVACFSGFSPEEKDRYHEIVLALGGTFTRDLSVAENTHLVAREARGPKFEAARSAKRMLIVNSKWLEDCLLLRRRVDEQLHGVDDASPNERKEGTGRQESSGIESRASLLMSLTEMLQREISSPSTLFSAGHFYFAGFTENDRTLRNQLGKLLRRGLGTIHWDYHDVVTHVIMKDGAEKSLGDSARAISLQRPNAPKFVSPRWAVQSWASGELVPESETPPTYWFDSTLATNKSMKAMQRAKEQTTSLMKGFMFCLLRVAPPHWAVDFDSEEVERRIRSNGGQMLSPKLLDALKVDHASAGTVAEDIDDGNNASSSKRTCYVVTWGGATPSHLEIHPLLSQLKRHSLCRLVQVTPIWLFTSIDEQRLIQVSRNPSLFVPGKHPIHALAPSTRGPERGNNNSRTAVPKKLESSTATGAAPTNTSVPATPAIRISVTGFSGSTRTAIRHAIQAMGATYDDFMVRKSTTHLICNEPTGAKYEKAVEWNLHVVSLKWLYHVMQYGFEGERRLKGGCEPDFVVEKPFA